MDRRVRTIAPAGLSGFFAPYLTNRLETTGAIGGGLGIDRAISVEVSIELDSCKRIYVYNYINNAIVESCIARYIAERLFQYANLFSGIIHINQNISVPIGGGYGTSGGSALAIAFAIARALDLSLDFYTITEIAHEADIICRSGLGTVSGITKPCNGITIVVKPGGPIYSEVLCIPLDSSILAVTAFYNPISKNNILSNHSDLATITKIGFETLKRIKENITPENFMDNCYRFAIESKLITPRIRCVIELLKKVDGVIGVSMNMIGEAIFALVDKNSIEKSLEILKETKPRWTHVWRPTTSSIAYIET